MNNIRVNFNLVDYQRLMLFAELCQWEISGLAKVKHENGIFTVSDVIVLPQTVSGASTVLSQDGLAEFLDEVVKNGGDPSEWRCWWHSHANMDCFWSQTDEATIEDFDLEQEANNWWLSVVVNKAGTVLSRLDVFQPVRITLDRLSWGFVPDENLRAQVLQEIETNVKEEKPAVYYGWEWNKKSKKNKGNRTKKVAQLSKDFWRQYDQLKNRQIAAAGRKSGNKQLQFSNNSYGRKGKRKI